MCIFFSVCCLFLQIRTTQITREAGNTGLNRAGASWETCYSAPDPMGYAGVAGTPKTLCSALLRGLPQRTAVLRGPPLPVAVPWSSHGSAPVPMGRSIHSRWRLPWEFQPFLIPRPWASRPVPSPRKPASLTKRKRDAFTSRSPLRLDQANLRSSSIVTGVLFRFQIGYFAVPVLITTPSACKALIVLLACVGPVAALTV